MELTVLGSNGIIHRAVLPSFPPALAEDALGGRNVSSQSPIPLAPPVPGHFAACDKSQG